MKDRKIVIEADSLLNTDQAAAFIGARASTMDVWRSKGRGPRYLKVGNSIKYRRSDLINYLDSVTIEPHKRTATAG